MKTTVKMMMITMTVIVIMMGADDSADDDDGAGFRNLAPSSHGDLKPRRSLTFKRNPEEKSEEC